jgi:hypothetical protein
LEAVSEAIRALPALALGAVSEAIRALPAPALEAVLEVTGKQALLVSAEEEQRPLKQQCVK